jgi:SAM-dependent methyltransferase
MEKSFSIKDILFQYFLALPKTEREKFTINSSNDPKSLSEGWNKALTTDTAEGIIESFRYYNVLNSISNRGNRDKFCLSYNETDALIYPFVVKSIFNMFPDEIGNALLKKVECSTVDDLINILKKSTAISIEKAIATRNSFRLTLMENINGPILSFLYSMVYLMGFSSGGESSFLTRVFPIVNKWDGHILDAGGGSGFAGLMLSTRGPTTYVDFSPFRAKRAKAIAKMATINEGNRDFFETMLDLIDLESGTFGLTLNRGLIPPLTTSITKNLHHESGDLSSLPKHLGPFDGAIITDVLEHTLSPEDVLSNVAMTLKPNAPLLLTVPTDQNGTNQKTMEEENGLTFPFLLHIRFFSDEMIEKMAQDAGLMVVELHPFSYKKIAHKKPMPMEVMALLRKD